MSCGISNFPLNSGTGKVKPMSFSLCFADFVDIICWQHTNTQTAMCLCVRINKTLFHTHTNIAVITENANEHCTCVSSNTLTIQFFFLLSLLCNINFTFIRHVARYTKTKWVRMCKHRIFRSRFYSCSGMNLNWVSFCRLFCVRLCISVCCTGAVWLCVRTLFRLSNILWCETMIVEFLLHIFTAARILSYWHAYIDVWVPSS